MDSSFGLNVIITYHILAFIAWLIFQTNSLWTREEVASWSMPDISSCYDAMSEVSIEGYPLGTPTVAVTFADFVVVLPLTMFAASGLLNREFYGAVSSWMIFGMNIYRTMMIFWQAVMSREFVATEPLPIIERTIIYFNLAFSIWGSWFQHKYFKKSIAL